MGKARRAAPPQEALHPRAAGRRLRTHVTSYTSDVWQDATSEPPELPELPSAELRFVFVSGRLSLAFCATVGERWRRSFERLRAPQDLARWYVAAGLLAAPIVVTEAGLGRARIVREAIYQIATAVAAGERPAAAAEETVNVAAAAAPLVPRMRDGVASWAALVGGAEAAALSVVARDAIDLFTSPLRSRVRECASSQCGLLFVDLSRPGQRRWCSSQACGGRARAAAYRHRRTIHRAS